MELVRLEKANPCYPALLLARFGKGRAPQLAALGVLHALAVPKTAFFCSGRCPGSVVLAAHDQAARWRDEGRCIVGGFHSPIEKECLRILLRGRQPVVVLAARGFVGMRIPVDWEEPLADGRLLALSQFGSSQRRATRDVAARRNLVAAALADEVVFAHVMPGGYLEQLRLRVASWNIPHRTLDAGATRTAC